MNITIASADHWHDKKALPAFHCPEISFCLRKTAAKGQAKTEPSDKGADVRLFSSKLLPSPERLTPTLSFQHACLSARRWTFFLGDNRLSVPAGLSAVSEPAGGPRCTQENPKKREEPGMARSSASEPPSANSR